MAEEGDRPLDPTELERLETQLADLLELPEEKRDLALARLRAERPELGPLLDRWLRAARTLDVAPGQERELERIGRYQVLDVLGEGGMGTVYLAEQKEPVRRRVALKVIKPGMGSKEVVARFELERRALAAMSHSAIARVFDCGTTERGQPYFVMELVEGLPITEYCDKHHLTLRERVELFRQVCAGVQHAHQKGVIHRDLKPGNVLVVREGEQSVPKILDFGLAKATNRELMAHTLYTERRHVLGTPEYMAPEQAAEDAEILDTRADIYSLGVILYELLTGALPFSSRELRMAGWAEMQRVLREVEPSKPSARISTIGERVTEYAQKRRLSPSALRKELRGELDWIVLKAMIKEPERRYGSASELAQDLERYLRQEPVLAGPPSATYRMAKFLRRYRGRVAAAAAILIALLIGGLATLYQFFETRREAERLLTLSTFVERNLVSPVIPYASGNKDITYAEILGRSIGNAPEALAAYPDLLAQWLDLVGDSLLKLGDYENAIPVLREAADICAQHGIPTARVGALNSLALCYRELGDLDRADAALAEAREVASEELPDDHRWRLTTLHNSALIAKDREQLDDAERGYREVLELRRQILGPDALDTLATQSELARVFEDAGRLGEAESMMREALDGYVRTAGPDHVLTLETMNMLAGIVQNLGKLDEAEHLLGPVVDGLARALGPEYDSALAARYNYGNLLQRLGKLQEAAEQLRSVREILLEKSGESDIRSIAVTNALALTLMSLGELEEAEALCLATLRVVEQSGDRQQAFTSLIYLGRIQIAKATLDEADAYFRRGLELGREVFGSVDYRVVSTEVEFGMLLTQRRQFAEASALLEGARQRARQIESLPQLEASAAGAIEALHAVWRRRQGLP